MISREGRKRLHCHCHPHDRRPTVKITKVLMLAGLCAFSLGAGTAMAQNKSPGYLMLQHPEPERQAGVRRRANAARSNQIQARSSNVAHSDGQPRS
jgi:hypothetical protein